MAKTAWGIELGTTRVKAVKLSEERGSVTMEQLSIISLKDYGLGAGTSSEDATAKERMSRKLGTESGRARYAKRKHIVEPVFGQMKHARGFRQFLLRGLNNVRGEWKLVCLTHNLLKIWRYRTALA